EKRFRFVSIPRLFLIRHVGETVGLLNPTSIVGGDAVKAILLGAHGIEKKKVVASVLLNRIILIVSQLSLFIIAISGLFFNTLFLSEINLKEKPAGIFPFILTPFRVIKTKITTLFSEVSPMLKNNKRMLLMSTIFALLHWF